MEQQHIPASRIGLVSCVKSKLDRAAPSQDLYTSPLFRGARAAVEASCDMWFVLSAEHDLLAPDDVIAPYERTLKNLPRKERREWSARVLMALQERLGPLDGHTFEIHAGRDYYDFGLAAGLRGAGARVELPLEGLMLGERLSYYAKVRQT